MAKKALITGITGQDGAYLAEFLLGKGYLVHAIKRRASSFNTARIDHLYRDVHESDARLFLHYGDLTDATNLIRVIQQVQSYRGLAWALPRTFARKLFESEEVPHCGERISVTEDCSPVATFRVHQRRSQVILAGE